MNMQGRTKLVSYTLMVAIVAFANAQHYEFEPPPKCGKCDPDACKPQFGCIAGMVKDRCGCCDICGNREGMRCDREDLLRIDPRNYLYGRCGKDMECKAHPNYSPANKETICYCKHDKLVCGSNGKTYRNVCQLTADVYRYGKEIAVRNDGPCPSEPLMDTPPESIHNFTGGHLTLSCEVTGFPAPIIEWHKTMMDGNAVVLPGYDRHVAVQSRGGPDKHQLTGWLQIEGFRRIHQGEYKCIAKNEYGSVQASAMIAADENFIDTDDELVEGEVDYDGRTNGRGSDTNNEIKPVEEKDNENDVKDGLFPEKESEEDLLSSGDGE
ncbi:insulin-like growth factor-binding protein-related protein 1 [Ptychodera flava]|uniref:insulin-like growth factor-binding protein-related protein 1 n=1 Tax=Ptychodera flava TaxID=63121 RepID=UPI00396A5141